MNAHQELKAFLAVERTLGQLAYTPMETAASHVIKGVSQAIKAGNFGLAHDRAQKIDFSRAREAIRKHAEVYYKSAYLLGASRVYGSLKAMRGSAATHLSKSVLDNQVSIHAGTVGHRAETLVKTALGNLVSRAEADHRERAYKSDLVKKIADNALADALNMAVDGTARMVSSISANLTTSRMVTYGFLSEATAMAVQTYKLEFVLDNRTSDICLALHEGDHVFRVDVSMNYMDELMRATDPESMKSIAPFLKSDDQTLLDLREMSDEDLQARGVMVPPFHFSCRTILIPGEVVLQQQDDGLAAVAVATDEATAADAEASAIEDAALLADATADDAAAQEAAESVRDDIDATVNELDDAGIDIPPDLQDLVDTADDLEEDDLLALEAQLDALKPTSGTQFKADGVLNKYFKHLLKYAPDQPRDDHGRFSTGDVANEKGQRNPSTADRQRARDLHTAGNIRSTAGTAEEGTPGPYRRGTGSSVVEIKGQPVEATRLTATTEAQSVFGKYGYASPDLLELHGANAGAVYAKAIGDAKASNPNGASVHAYSEQEYSKMRLFLTDGGTAGVAVKSDGDIVSVFNTPGGHKGVAPALLQAATQHGGTKLDAFDTVLPDIYATTAGFTPVARLKWDDSQAPAGWDKKAFAKFNKGEPDVVFMAYDPKRAKPYYPGEGPTVATYDDALAAQDKAIQKFKRKAEGIFGYLQLIAKYDPDQPRAKDGKWTSGGAINQIEYVPASENDTHNFVALGGDHLDSTKIAYHPIGANTVYTGHTKDAALSEMKQVGVDTYAISHAEIGVVDMVGKFHPDSQLIVAQSDKEIADNAKAKTTETHGGAAAHDNVIAQSGTPLVLASAEETLKAVEAGQIDSYMKNAMTDGKMVYSGETQWDAKEAAKNSDKTVVIPPLSDDQKWGAFLGGKFHTQENIDNASNHAAAVEATVPYIAGTKDELKVLVEAGGKATSEGGDLKPSYLVDDGKEGSVVTGNNWYAAQQNMKALGHDYTGSDAQMGLVDPKTGKWYDYNNEYAHAKDTFEASMKKEPMDANYSEGSADHAYELIEQGSKDDFKEAVTNGYAVYAIANGKNYSSAEAKALSAGWSQDEVDKMQVGYLGPDDNFYTQDQIDEGQSMANQEQADKDNEDEVNQDDEERSDRPDPGDFVTETANFTGGERTSLTDYKGSGHRDMNETLRNGETSIHIKNIDAAFAKSEVSEDTTVYRGIETAGLQSYKDLMDSVADPKALVGTLIRKPTYQSVSLSRDVADNFGDKVFLEITLKAGTPAINMEPFASLNESELLLPHGGAYRIDDIIKDKYQTLIKATFIPPDELEDDVYNPHRGKNQLNLPGIKKADTSRFAEGAEDFQDWVDAIGPLTVRKSMVSRINDLFRR